MINIKLKCVFILLIISTSLFGQKSQPIKHCEEVYPGIWCFTLGNPDSITPEAVRGTIPDTSGINLMPQITKCPVQPSGEITERGILLSIPLEVEELIYGLGLQMQSFQQRGSKKLLRVNADPEINTGDSHAPVPFYVTTKGYGIYIDNARYLTYYLGNKKKKPQIPDINLVNSKSEDGWNALNGPYERLGINQENEVLVEIPR